MEMSQAGGVDFAACLHAYIKLCFMSKPNSNWLGECREGNNAYGNSQDDLSWEFFCLEEEGVLHKAELY